MNIGVFDSGLGGLTVVKEIQKSFKGANLFYIADTKFAPYGEKTHEEILSHSIDITDYLIKEHNIQALIVACNTATSAAIVYLRENYKNLIVIGCEPGIKPAVLSSRSKKVGVLATPATLSGLKYQELANELSNKNEVTIYEKACPGLVQEIEKGFLDSKKIETMLRLWLEPMKEKGVDTIVLGCTHYPLVSSLIKRIMDNKVCLIETGEAIAKRLLSLSQEKAHVNEGLLKIFIYSTDKINLDIVNKIINNYTQGGKIMLKGSSK